MSSPSRRRAAVARVGWVVFAWLAVALVVSVVVLQVVQPDQDVTWREALTPTLIFCLTWALLTPPLLGIAARFPLTAGRMGRAVAVRIALALVAAFLHLNLYALLIFVSVMLPGSPGVIGTFGMFYVGRIWESLLIAALILGGEAVAERIGRRRREELRQARLQARLAEARLAALSMELQPHFLFNTLNAISSLVHDDPEGADRMIVQLSDLLRRTLDAGRAPMASVAEEIEVLGLYIAIQQVRFGPRLVVDLRVADDARGALVPRFILQPIVENALQHGLGPKKGPVRLRIDVGRDGDDLVLRVEDDGVGLRPGHREGTGTGNARARLQHLYPARHALQIGPREGGGTAVMIRLPATGDESITAAAAAPSGRVDEGPDR